MWVIAQTDSRPKCGAVTGNNRPNAFARQVPVAEYRTRAEAVDQLGPLTEWATAGVGQSYHATTMPTYEVRPADPAPTPPPTGQTIRAE